MLGTALAVFCVSWIFSMFFGAGPKRLIRIVGGAISAILAMIASVIAILAIVGLVITVLLVRRFIRNISGNNRYHF